MSKNDAEVTAVRSSVGLRNVLFDELDSLRAGNSDPKKANAVARLSSEIVRTIMMEIEVAKYTRSTRPKNDKPVEDQQRITERVPEPVLLGGKQQ